jgi:hypothetical protein
MEGLSKIIARVSGLLFFFLLTTGIDANPMLPPKAVISELKFLEGGSWILEIGFEYGTGYSKGEYDSIFVKTSSGYSQILLNNLPDGTTEFLLTRDSLPSTIDIDKSGDYIVLITYRDELDIPHADSVSFGGLPNSMIPGILPIEYSITRLFIYSDYLETEIPVFARDKSPTIGLPNDTVGTTGILKGHIYDKNNNPVKGDSFIMDNPLIIDSSGNYVTNYFSRKIISHYIYQNTGRFTIFLLTNNYEIDMYPDSTVILDIYLTDYVSGVSEEIPLTEIEPEIINYPTRLIQVLISW